MAAKHVARARPTAQCGAPANLSHDPPKTVNVDPSLFSEAQRLRKRSSPRDIGGSSTASPNEALSGMQDEMQDEMSFATAAKRGGLASGAVSLHEALIEAVQVTTANVHGAALLDVVLTPESGDVR